MPLVQTRDFEANFEFDQNRSINEIFNGIGEVAIQAVRHSPEGNVSAESLSSLLADIGIGASPDTLESIGRSEELRSAFVVQDGAFLPHPDNGDGPAPSDRPFGGDPRVMVGHYVAGAALGAVIGLVYAMWRSGAKN